MDFDAFLSPLDAQRAHRTLEKLRLHSIAPLTLTGGMAIELHRLRFGPAKEIRRLNDFDFLADSFDEIPKTLSKDFLFRHVHPHDPSGKTLIQCVDPETAIRVDVFHAETGTMARAISFDLCDSTMRIVSVEDLIARAACLCMNLVANLAVPAKHARDFLRLLPLADLQAMEPIWREHQKPNHPESLLAAANLLTDLIATRKDLQIVPIYSKDVYESCLRCAETEGFPLAGASRVLSILGYC
jgi:hypothetical protein